MKSMAWVSRAESRVWSVSQDMLYEPFLIAVLQRCDAAACAYTSFGKAPALWTLNMTPRPETLKHTLTADRVYVRRGGAY